MKDLQQDLELVELEGESLDAVSGGVVAISSSALGSLDRYVVPSGSFKLPSSSLALKDIGTIKLDRIGTVSGPFVPRCLNVVPKDLAELVAELDEADDSEQ